MQTTDGCVPLLQLIAGRRQAGVDILRQKGETDGSLLFVYCASMPAVLQYGGCLLAWSTSTRFSRPVSHFARCGGTLRVPKEYTENGAQRPSVFPAPGVTCL